MASDSLRNPNPLPEPALPETPAAVPDAGEGAAGSSSKLVWIGGAVLVVALVVAGLGAWWSIQPATFEPEMTAREMLGEDTELVPGAVTVASAIQVAETLLSKPGGYLHNDVAPPGVVMDNMPHWEYGLLTELRDSVRSMRNDFSRSQTQSIENTDLKQADSKFNFGADAWILPSSEESYRQGVQALRGYLDALASGRDQTARFYTRADNLGAYLAVVEKRLGSFGQRLTSSVGDAELTAALADSLPTEGAQALQRTPWTEIDDVFYEARGYTWALLHMMKALSVDFASVLEDKNATVSMQQIIRDLEHAARRKWSPIVLNGHGFGVLANHSLVLASYMARANAAVLDLRVLLQRG